MTESNDLDARIAAELAEAERRIAEIQEEAGREFEAQRERHDRFRGIAARILDSGDQPLARLAAHFENAEVSRRTDHSGVHATCTFRHTARFPASVELRFDITHDETIRQLIVHYRLQILPIFIDFEPSDRLVRDLETVDEAEVARWIEDKIVEFVRTYLRIPFAEEYQREGLVTDPVAEVRFSRELAAGSVEHEGHTYWFVSEASKSAFEADPARWVMAD